MENHFGFNLDNSYSRLPASFFSYLDPTPVPAPEAVCINDKLATSLGLEDRKSVV